MTQKNRSKSLVMYSDIHNGSKLAVCTPHPELKDGEYKPNKLQAELYQMWQESIDELTQKPRFKVINGEPIDGPNKKQLGRQSWTT
ncbi:MAG: hypothetical protein KGI05_05580, partial [Thaumarchaeota archaeon]|nr:hypothetical protein [Nitrososphaerota archaeon]